MKIIQMLHHSHPFYKQNEEVHFFAEDWHAKVARQILNRTDKYEIECWRPERRAKKIITGEEGGITYKIFPSFYLRFGMEYSIPLLRELRKETQKEEVLIHLHGIHNHLAYLVAYLFRDLPIVGQQHGGLPFLYKFKNSNHPLRFLYLLNHIPEKLALKNIDHFFVLTKYEKESLSKLVGADKVEIQTMGVDFDKFKPMNKEYARELLGLPIDKKIILYIGRFNKTKRVDLILDALQKLKGKYDIELILIGGQKNDIFFDKAKSVGTRVIGRIPSDQLIPYYSASDVYNCFYNTNLGGGIGIAPVESLACGTPIVSNTLEHFTTDEKKYLINAERLLRDIMIGKILLEIR
jgi:glycosyltransferase involved in cell wall biosynthesis